MFKRFIVNSLYLLFIINITLTTLNGMDEIYFLPSEANRVENEILNYIKKADKKIDIAMYNLSYKKFVKALKKASKNGVDINIIYDKSDLKLPKEFNLIKTKRKQHIKLAIIDEKYVIFGSSNWTKDSFGENYEVINITDEKEKVEKFIEIFNTIKKENN